MQLKLPKFAVVPCALALLVGCQAEKTNVPLRNMTGSPVTIVLKRMQLRLANGQVFELTPNVQANLKATPEGEPIVRFAPVGGTEQCFVLHLAEVPADYYLKGSPRRLGVELGQDGNLSAFPKPGKAPRAGVKLPKVACGA